MMLVTAKASETQFVDVTGKAINPMCSFEIMLRVLKNN